MPKKTVFEKSMDSDITREAGDLEVMSPPKGMKFKVEIEFDKALEGEFGRDSILLEEMNEAAQKIYEDLVERVGDNLKKTDKGGIQLRDTNELAKMQKLVETVNKGIEGAVGVAEEKAEKAVLAVWTTYAAKKKEYTKYKIKIGVTIASAAAGLAVSIGLMASAPFTGGAGAAFSIIGMVKSATTMVKEVVSAWQSVEESANVLEKQLALMKAAFAKVTKDNAELNVPGQVNEYAAAVVNQFLGISQPSIKSCKNNSDTANQKLTGITVACHETSKTLNKILDEQEKLEKDYVAEAKKRLSKHPSPKWPDQLKTIEARLSKELQENYVEVVKMIGKIKEEHERVKKATELVERLTEDVKKLEACRGKGVVYLENALLITDLAMTPLDGNARVSTWLDLGKNIAVAGGNLAIDRINSKVLGGTWLA